MTISNAKGCCIELVETEIRLDQPDEDILKDWLQNRLNEERYQHSLGTQHKAIEIARNFGFSAEDIEKVGTAGLLHDAAKLMPQEELISYCESCNIAITEEDRQLPQTLHSFVGAELARKEFNISDEDTLNAIRYHATGRNGMSDIEKIVYIADKIEENTRNPLYIQKINALINFKERTTLDKALLYLFNSTITFLVEKGEVVHTRTVKARNELVVKLKNKITCYPN